MSATDPTRIDIETDPTLQRISGITVHGNISFDAPFISEIADNLWQGGCEDGLVLPEFIKHVVSLYKWEAYDVRHELASSLTVEMYDRGGPVADGEADAIAAWVNTCRKSGPVLVHCQAGLNRSSLVVARALMLEGTSADDAIKLIREKRDAACLCNKSFESWLRELA